MKGRTIQTQIKENFSMADFRALAQQNFNDIDQYRFVIGPKQIDLKDERQFNAVKPNIVNGVTIFVLQRLAGGAAGGDSGWMEIAKLINAIQYELPKEWPQFRKSTAKCIGCLDNKQCVKLHCCYICEECFLSQYRVANYNLKCPQCNTKVTPNSVFNSSKFAHLLDKLVQSQDLLKNIDCQICTCGALLNNTTMYSQQQCNNCHRKLCFFCNKDWDTKTMRNDQYTCHYNCDYETKITYDLTPCTEFDKNLMIPNRRCCPKCFYVGAFGERCKYHTCFACGYHFCFLCLNEHDECHRKYATSDNKNGFYRIQCTPPQKQNYSMFPRLFN